MVPLSPKRRKLDHESSSADLAEDDASSVVNDLPEKKQARQKQSHMQNADQSALYAAGQYKSSIFKLQVDEMLAELRPNYAKRMPVINQALHQIHSLIEAIEDREALPVCYHNQISGGKLSDCLVVIRSYELASKITQDRCAISRTQTRQGRRI